MTATTRRGAGLALVVLALIAATANAPAANTPPPTEVIDESRPVSRPCPPISNVTPYYMRGGCILEEAGWGIDAYAMTPVGEIKLAHCNLFIRVLVDGRGRAPVDGFGGIGSNCDQFNVCFPGANPLARVPFEGRLYRDRTGGLHQQIAMCLDTRMGRFRGDFDIPLHDVDGVWRSKQRVSISVGSSGMRLVGKWRLKRNISDRHDETDRATHLDVRTNAD